jgi:hypothetical protein
MHISCHTLLFIFEIKRYVLLLLVKRCNDTTCKVYVKTLYAYMASPGDEVGTALAPTLRPIFNIFRFLGF